MVGAWIADVTPLYDKKIYEAFYKSVPDFRKEKADGLHSPQKRAQSIGAWYLLEKIVEKYGLEKFPIYNLSHSGDYVLCAIDMEGNKDVAVGCDIEKMQKANLKIAERFFCDSEYKYILRQDSKAKQCETFYRYWVLKESFVKATRRGLAQDTKSFEIRLDNPPVLIKKPKEFGEYYYREFDVTGLPYKIAVCSDKDEICKKINTEFMNCFKEKNSEQQQF